MNQVSINIAMIFYPAIITGSHLIIFGLAVLIALLVYLIFRTRKSIKKYEDKISRLRHETDKDLIEGVFYAQTLQQSVLPDEAAIRDSVKDCFIINMPKDLVSGDFYWFRDFGSYFIIAVIDCTGHGIAGGFMSMIGSTLLNRIIIEKSIHEPSAILENLDINVNDIFLKENNQHNLDFGMELSICKVEKETKTVTFSGAHRPLVYIADGKINEIKGTRRPIGGRCKKIESNEFKDEIISFHNQISLYMFTDGLPDQNNSEIKKFGKKRLLRTIKDSEDLSMREQKYRIITELNLFRKSSQQRDDITLIGIRIS